MLVVEQGQLKEVELLELEEVELEAMEILILLDYGRTIIMC